MSRAETRLAQEKHKLERLENRKKYLEQGVQAAISTEEKRSRSPEGPRRRRKVDARHKTCIHFLRLFFRWRFRRQRKAALWPMEGTPPVSPCKPLCAIFLRKANVYPLSPVKANVGRLWEKLKIGMKSGLEQRCDGNFLAIFAGVSIGEKSNFTGRFFEWRRPFDKSTR